MPNVIDTNINYGLPPSSFLESLGELTKVVKSFFNPHIQKKQDLAVRLKFACQEQKSLFEMTSELKGILLADREKRLQNQKTKKQAELNWKQREGIERLIQWIPGCVNEQDIAHARSELEKYTNLYLV